MGRFTSVQAYADNNANLRKLTYEQATGVAETSTKDGSGGNKSTTATGGGGGGVTTEKVVNPYGSTAGAGSGEFHVYRHARAREMARWKNLDEEQQRKLLEEEFLMAQNQSREQLEAQTEKRRRKRQREKEAKQRKRHLTAAGIPVGQGLGTGSNHGRRRDGGSDDNKNDDDDDDGQDDFVYTSQQFRNRNDNGDEEEGPPERGTEGNVPTGNKDETTAIPTDGSFLEMMKQKLNDERERNSSSGVPTAPASVNVDPSSATNLKGESADDEDIEGPMLPLAATKQTLAVETNSDNKASTVRAPVEAPTKKARIIETKLIDEDF